MSRIGKSPLQIPEKVSVTLNGRTVIIEGPKGKLSYRLPSEKIKIDVAGKVVTISCSDLEGGNLFGLARTLIQNMVTGVANGYSKELEITGVGYKVEQKGNELMLHVGYSSPQRFVLPAGIAAEVFEKQTRIRLTGVDKQLVGNVAAELRSIRKPDVYKGKGIKYIDEVIRRKAGKAVAGGGKG